MVLLYYRTWYKKNKVLQGVHNKESAACQTPRLVSSATKYKLCDNLVWPTSILLDLGMKLRIETQSVHLQHNKHMLLVEGR